MTKMNFKHLRSVFVFLFFIFAAITAHADYYVSPGYFNPSYFHYPPKRSESSYLLSSGCQKCAALTYDNLENELRSRGVEIIQTGDEVEIVLGTDRIFMPKSNTRLRYSQVETMKLVTFYLRTLGEARIVVYAHTDNVGSDKSKFKRTKQQAQTILAFLWSNGIPLADLRAVGCGDTEPVSSNQTIDASASNRRIEIIRY